MTCAIPPQKTSSKFVITVKIQGASSGIWLGSHRFHRRTEFSHDTTREQFNYTKNREE